LHDDPLFVDSRRGYAAALKTLAADVLTEMEHVEALFKAYEEAWREVEIASGFMERPSRDDQCRWDKAAAREATALHALLSYQDKSLNAFKIRADCIQMILRADKPVRDLGDNRDAFATFVSSVAHF